ncbi:hypothetical protein JTE90_026364 [Oedothorax gibbosus]|uniref:Uncharacterized protein n=1 Tax=Oedothorax gibbosus TaxID=931172 RepID=A0AAV6TKZ0_9ARAC|nr:hypothetical protein JTE90_026364 [Oedothorax gibbosus]
MIASTRLTAESSPSLATTSAGQTAVFSSGLKAAPTRTTAAPCSCLLQTIPPPVYWSPPPDKRTISCGLTAVTSTLTVDVSSFRLMVAPSRSRLPLDWD